ncbi:MAG: hypothetical protein ACRD2I_19985 [Vicinamibacterales bacterium]
MASLQPMTPPALDHIVRTCLAKDPDMRRQSAGDLARELQWITAVTSQPATSIVRSSAQSPPWPRTWMLWFAGACIAVAALGLERLAGAGAHVADHGRGELDGKSETVMHSLCWRRSRTRVALPPAASVLKVEPPQVGTWSEVISLVPFANPALIEPGCAF